MDSLPSFASLSTARTRFRSRLGFAGVTAGFVVVAGGAPAYAADTAPSAEQIVGQMRAALEPQVPSVRRMTLAVRHAGEEKSFTLVQARKRLADGARSLTILIGPDDAKGLAYLVAEKKPGEKENREWLYVPYVRRTRELVPAENYTSFLDSDFTYADLGFLDSDGTTKLLGSEPLDGRPAYKIETIPGTTTKQWYYARIVTWIDAETLLPLKREFYSPSGLRFKVETFSSVSRVDGIPTPFSITMENLPAGTSSQLTVNDVAYNVDIPDEYFGPDKVSTIASLAFWAQKHGD